MDDCDSPDHEDEFNRTRSAWIIDDGFERCSYDHSRNQSRRIGIISAKDFFGRLTIKNNNKTKSEPWDYVINNLDLDHILDKKCNVFLCVDFQEVEITSKKEVTEKLSQFQANLAHYLADKGLFIEIFLKISKLISVLFILWFYKPKRVESPNIHFCGLDIPTFSIVNKSSVEKLYEEMQKIHEKIHKIVLYNKIKEINQFKIEKERRESLVPQSPLDKDEPDGKTFKFKTTIRKNVEVWK